MKINYDFELWCHHCGEKHLRSKVEFRPKYGYKCPECGQKMRTKATFNVNNYRKKHPYVKNRKVRGKGIVTEIRQIAKEIQSSTGLE